LLGSYTGIWFYSDTLNFLLKKFSPRFWFVSNQSADLCTVCRLAVSCDSDELLW